MVAAFLPVPRVAEAMVMLSAGPGSGSGVDSVSATPTLRVAAAPEEVTALTCTMKSPGC